MKKKLLLVPCFLLLLVSFAIPGSAAESYSGHVVTPWVYFNDIVSGDYALIAYQSSDPDSILLNIPLFQVDSGNHVLNFTGLDSEFDTVQLSYTYRDDRLALGVRARFDRDGALVDLFDTDLYPDLVVELTPVFLPGDLLSDYLAASGDAIFQVLPRIQELYVSDLGLTLPGVTVAAIAGAAISLGCVILIVGLIRRRK